MKLKVPCNANGYPSLNGFIELEDQDTHSPPDHGDPAFDCHEALTSKEGLTLKGWNGGVIVDSPWGGTFCAYSRSHIRSEKVAIRPQWPEQLWFVVAVLRGIAQEGPSHASGKTVKALEAKQERIRKLAAELAAELTEPDFYDS